MNICIYGASSAELEQIYYDKTEELGRMMAKRGLALYLVAGRPDDGSSSERRRF